MNNIIPEVTRTPTTIRYNTLPKSHLSQWLSDAFILEFRFKPAIDNTLVMVEVCPLFIIVEAKTRKELYRFQTQTTFSFSGNHSKPYVHGLIHHLVNLTIGEFNSELQKTSSYLAAHRTFEKMTFEEFEPRLKQAIQLNSNPAGIKPHWMSSNSNSIEENDVIISQLPPIPEHKIFLGQNTAEQLALTNCFKDDTPTEGDLTIIKDCINFYKECFATLKKIDLTKLTDDQYHSLKRYMKHVMNAQPTMCNDVSADAFFRVTIVSDKFLQDGKVKDAAYLCYPPLKINHERGIYNRANSPDRTIFYCSFQENVAIRETKPEVGKRIIISTWQNKTEEPLNAFPLCLTAGIPNEYTDRNSYAFEKICERMPTVLAEWMGCIFAFLSSEFIKEAEPIHPKRYDYIFSAWFADSILQPFPENSSMKDFDCIVYPSVAWNHLPDNMAVLPTVVDQKFVLVQAREFEIMETWYDRKIPLGEYPARLKFIRHSVNIKNGKIRWNDE